MLRFTIVWREDEYKGRLSPVCHTTATCVRDHQETMKLSIGLLVAIVANPTDRQPSDVTQALKDQLNELVPGFDLDDVDEQSSSISKMNGESIDTIDNDDFLKSILAMDFLDN